MAPTERRIFFRQVAAIAGGATLRAPAAGVAMLAPFAAASAAEAATAPPATGYQSFGPSEASFVEALVNVMCPADALTPNGVNCGLALFIDRQLAGAFGKGARLYRDGPFRPGRPQLGYQLPLTPEEFFKAGIADANDACRKRFGKAFDELTAANANAFLEDLAAGKASDQRVPLAQWFNELVYPLFLQACFADPLYGGNRGKVFWKMIGYPGLPALHTRDMVDYRGKPYPAAANPKSIEDFLL